MAQKKNPVWGIIDVGSNTFRLCVYELGESGSYEELANAKVALGLASFLTPDGALRQDGVDKACKALAKLVRMANLMQCDEVCVFATAAVRNCSNSKDVVAQLEMASWTKIEVISGEEEARLSLLGAQQSVELDSGLFFDIGGGSTELMSLAQGKMQVNESIPLGSLNAWRRCCAQILPQRYELELLAVEVGRQLDKQGVPLPEHCHACGIGGTMRFALKVAKLLGAECARRTLSQADIELIFSALDSDPNHLARLMLQQNPARVHTLLPGCTIAREIIHRLDCDSVVVAKTGVREGYLQRKIAQDLKR
ncbi:MAG: hypothetical protein ACI36W_04505 [Coriobacteriales bacterium]